MRVFAYLYIDPLLEPSPKPLDWGRDVEQVYQDRGDRHQLDTLLTDCRHNPPDYLLVRQLEDLGDSLDEVRDRLSQLETLGVSLLATEASILATDQPLQPSDLLALFKTLQENQRRRQIQQGHARNRLKALPPPGKAPYGYRRGKDRYVIDRATAPVVKEFFDHFILYGSLRGSVRHLQKKYNKKMSVSTAQRWLSSPVYRGDLAYGDGDVVSDTHAAIISRQEAAQVDRLLRRNRQLAPRAASAPRSLSGLVVCRECQSPMTVTRVTARRQSQEYLYLRPTACPRRPKCRAIPYAQVLEKTIQRICADLAQAVAGAPLPDVERVKQGLEQQVAAKQQILEQIPALVDSGVLDGETAELRVYKLRTEMAALQARVAQLPPVSLQAIAQTVSIPQFWFDLSESERRFYFREFIRQIQICRQEEDWAIQLVFVF